MPELFVPDIFQNDAPLEVIRNFPLAQLICSNNDGIMATASPIIIDDTRGNSDDLILIGHMAKANHQSTFMQSGQNILAVFSSPNAYISPDWYKERKTVPTWDYQSVHINGAINIFDDHNQHLDVLSKTIAHVERYKDTPWTMEKAPEGKVESLLPRIISFEIVVERIQAISRLSQMQTIVDRHSVIEGLRTRNQYGDLDVASLIEAQMNAPSGGD